MESAVEYLYSNLDFHSFYFIEIGRIFDHSKKKSLEKINYCPGKNSVVFSIDGIQSVLSKLSQRKGLQEIMPIIHNSTYNCTDFSKEAPGNLNYGCLINIRKELIFSEHVTSQLSESETLSTAEGKEKIAFLVPTYNSPHQEAPVIEKFLLSTLNETLTLDELKKYSLTVYIGYDEGDKFFDANHEDLRQKYYKLYPEIKFKFFKMPKVHWLTMLWNRLYVSAYNQNNDYFIQINDDVKFLDKGWLNIMVQALKDKHKGSGVIGFNDVDWNCKLFTQAMVGRNHFIKFQGLLYPAEIPNLYSDDWLTKVYGASNSTCIQNARIKNSNVKIRYSSCFLNDKIKGVLNQKG